MNIDAVLGQNPENPLIAAVTPEPFGDSVGLDHPQPDCICPPDRVRSQTANQHGGQYATIALQPRQKTLQRRPEVLQLLRGIQIVHIAP